MNATTTEATEFLERFARAWADNDGEALGRFFTTDGSLVNPFGQRADGAEAIGAMYSEYFAGLLAGTTTEVADVTSRTVTDGVVFVDAEQMIKGAGGDLLMAIHLAALLVRDEDEWRFADARPYLPASPAGR